MTAGDKAILLQVAKLISRESEELVELQIRWNQGYFMTYGASQLLFS